MSFYTDLENRLNEHAVAIRSQARPARPERRVQRSFRSRVAIVGGSLAIAAAAWATFQSSEGSLQLAVLQTATADASDIRSLLPLEIRNAADLKKAHPFETPNGVGYVFSTTSDQLCLLVPDFVPDSYGSSCAPVEKAERAGLFVSMEVQQDSPRAGVAVLVLPTAATSASFQPSDRAAAAKALTPQSGVVALPVHENGTLEWKTGDAKPRRETLTKVTKESGSDLIQCPSGYVRAPIGSSPDDVC